MHNLMKEHVLKEFDPHLNYAAQSAEKKANLVAYLQSKYVISLIVLC